MKVHVFIIGSKGIPAKYGGFETFVEMLTKGRKSPSIQYHVACMGDQNQTYKYQGAQCFQIKVPNIGAAKAVYYDLAALCWCIREIRKKRLRNGVVYILACRVGPFIRLFKKTFKQYHFTLLINPDGHEWLRGKWNAAIRSYWKQSEKQMVRAGDLIICDSQNIQTYIQKEYSRYRPQTEFIPYGGVVQKSSWPDNHQKLQKWYQSHDLAPKKYYLVVGRFVPENNYELLIKEFLETSTDKKLVLITNVENNKFYNRLIQETDFTKDPRIHFAGTVYDSELLKKIRENAYAYLHGHEVGGTNPSLLEALGSTDLNLLLNVSFNQEVARDSAMYFSKRPGDLAALIRAAEQLTESERLRYGEKAKEQIEKRYSWEQVILRYETTFRRAVYNRGRL